MFKKTILSLLVFAVFSLPAVAAKKTLLKIPIFANSNLEVVGTTPVWLAKQVDEVSAGQLKLKIYEPGRLIPPKEILQAVHAGQIQGGFTATGFSSGILGTKANFFTAVPFGPDAPEYMAWIYYGGGRDLWQRMYDDEGLQVHSIPCGILAPETSGWFNRPIDKPEDLQGLRMRFFGLGALVMEKLGVSTSLLPGAEVFPALEKGAIDATEFSMPAIDERLGFYKILKYNYYPGWHQPATLLELLINKSVWVKLSKPNKALLELACKASVANSLAFGEAIQFPAMQKNVADRGVQNRYWSKQMLDLFREKWLEVAAEQSSKDKKFKEIWDSLNSFNKGYSIWSEKAFLPRPGTQRVSDH